ncbi:hypothetical protein QWZ06_05970 [Chryseobacterium tructae]|uniref:YcxB family protein n=1 Tax=Chryseobacterium tructae TaxID=1037380 RepID=A0ABV7XUG1_9FLAO|nr:hypothetical protein [Chryseobacterium tructae]MDN3691830.1 hypothetical protein [Chryseobacterium tructae]
MRALKKLDIRKSIHSKKLIFEEGWTDRFDTLTVYFAFLALIWFSIWGIKETEISIDNGLEYLVLTCIFSFSLYVLYCKFTEKHLKEIKFDISKTEAKDRVIKYAQKRYRISTPANNLLYLNEPTDLYSPGNYEQTVIIFFKDNSILYTLLKEGSKTNLPVLLSQHFFKMQFKKILQQNEPELEIKNKSYFRSFFHG